MDDVNAGNQGSQTGQVAATGSDAGQDGKQSTGLADGQASASAKSYKVGDRELSADQLYEEHNRELAEKKVMNKNFTERTQRLSAYEKKYGKELDLGDNSGTQGSGVRQAIKGLDVPPEVREAVVEIVAPLMEDHFNRKITEREQRQATDQFLKDSWSTLKSEWDGKDGKPKFSESEQQKVLDDMANPGNRIFDPKVFWETKNQAAINDWRVKQALKGAGGPPRTERGSTTGVSGKQPPATSLKTFKDAGEALRDRIHRGRTAV